jgi:glycosyltransferase involved in cell wall biosynthesis
MRVAFYAPIKPPDHPVPSGDRLMARLLIRALELGGASVEVMSVFRPFRKTPPTDGIGVLQVEAEAEISRIAASWSAGGAPDLVFCYHPYYKAPDLIGPVLAQQFSLPYVTVEASYSRRRDAEGWQAMQAPVGAAVRAASVNISMTDRDREGLLGNFADARSALLSPFLDAMPFLVHTPKPVHGQLVTVAMMREGDKLDSYRLLAAALGKVATRTWSLAVVGDGPVRGAVEELFSGFEAGRIVWHGQLDQSDIAGILANGAVFVWPGVGEAYGLVYLEAQAAGLPVVAQSTAGVPSVVLDGRTGVLTPDGDINAFAAAIDRLLSDEELRSRLACNARRFVAEERSLEGGSRRLMTIIREFTGLS